MSTSAGAPGSVHGVTRLDWIALGVVAISAFAGLRRGLVVGLFSVAGFVAGAVIGGRIARHLLAGGTSSPYLPLAALAGALVLAGILQGLGGMAGSVARGGLRGLPPLRALDTAGGAVLGAALGLAFVWAVGAVALQVPGQTELRQAVQRSEVLRRLNAIVPPSRLLQALHRVDPFPSIAGPQIPSLPVDPRVLRDPAVRRAAPSVVRVLGTACGLGVSGSGWVARPGIVVTAAHVVAGQTDTVVVPPGTVRSYRAFAVAFDARDDVAVLRVPGLPARPLRAVEAPPGTAVALVGYPGNGPLTYAAGRIGATSTVFTRDAYGRGPVARSVTAIAGLIRHGDSGGPAVDRSGAVTATMFAARVGARAGYGIPTRVVRQVLDSAGHRVSTGACAL
jgi:S1-C subfamily serine protease